MIWPWMRHSTLNLIFVYYLYWIAASLTLFGMRRTNTSKSSHTDTGRFIILNRSERRSRNGFEHACFAAKEITNWFCVSLKFQNGARVGGTGETFDGIMFACRLSLSPIIFAEIFNFAFKRCLIFRRFRVFPFLFHSRRFHRVFVEAAENAQTSADVSTCVRWSRISCLANTNLSEIMLAFSTLSRHSHWNESKKTRIEKKWKKKEMKEKPSKQRIKTLRWEEFLVNCDFCCGFVYCLKACYG